MSVEELRIEARRLFEELELLAEEHDELTDSDVREAMHDCLNYYFVWGASTTEFPCDVRMFSKEENELVRSVLERFVSIAVPLAKKQNLSLGEARLGVLQDPEIVTSKGSKYDVFIGHVDKPLPLESLPSDMFELLDLD